MTRRSMWPAVALVLVGCAGEKPATDSTKSSASAAFTAADSAAILSVNDRLRAAGKANNWDGWLAEMTPDAVFMPPNAGMLSGKPAIDGYLKAYPKLTAFDFTVAEVIGRADVAETRGTFTLSTAAGAAGPAMSDEGKYMSVFMKQADGSWKLVRDIWNSSKPLAPPPAK